MLHETKYGMLLNYSSVEGKSLSGQNYEIDHNIFKLEINNKNIHRKIPVCLKVRNTFLINLLVKKGIKKKL